MTLGAAQAQMTEGKRVLGSTPAAVMSEQSALKAAGTSDTGYFTYNVFLRKGFANSYTLQIFDTSTASRVDQVTPNDSGYIFGINRNLNRGYAEQFHFRYKTDTALKILGLRTLFSGRVSSSSRAITFGLFRKGGETPYVGANPKTYNTGLPTTTLASIATNANQLGTNGAAGVDTFKNFWLSTPYSLAKADSDFFAGFTMAAYTYTTLNADTFGIRSSRGGEGIGVGAYLRSATVLDTMLLDQNVFMNNAGTWNDIYWTYGYIRNLSLVPIVQLTGAKLGVEGGLTRNGLTLMGAFPNPATTQATLRFSLKNSVSVIVELSDMAGRTIRTEQYKNLATGQHDIKMSTADLATGNYVMMVLTSEGDAIATQISVAK